MAFIHYLLYFCFCIYISIFCPCLNVNMSLSYGRMDPALGSWSESHHCLAGAALSPSTSPTSLPGDTFALKMFLCFLGSIDCLFVCFLVCLAVFDLFVSFVCLLVFFVCLFNDLGEKLCPIYNPQSTNSVIFNHFALRRRWGGPGMRSDARNGRSMGLGVRRPMMGGRGRRGGRWLGRRGGWGVNRGRRGGGGRRGARRPPPPSREQLDKEIEVV